MSFSEDFSDSSLIKKRSRLIAAAVQDDVEIVKELLDSDKWYGVKDKYGSNLLQICILWKNKEVFDYLLSLNDFPLELEDRHGKTALVTAVCSFGCEEEYYAKELIKRGADVNRMGYEDKLLTHWAIDREFIEVLRLLIEHGADIDAQNEDGSTVLHSCFDMSNPEETAAMLLWYGADATILDHDNFSAFHMAVVENCDVSVQEHLFYYTYNQDMRYKFPARVLLTLTEFESPLFDQVLDIVGEVFYDDSLQDCCFILFTMNTKYLQVLIDKLDFFIKEMLTEYCSKVKFFHGYKDISVENFDMLLKSKLKPEVLDLISEINKNKLLNELVQCGMPEAHLTELVCFLLSYGLVIHEADFETIYGKFGYCDLFKILLYMDVEKRVEPCFIYVMPRLICDMTDIQDIVNNLPYSVSEIQQLLCYSAHPKLIQHCYNRCSPLEISLAETIDRSPVQLKALYERLKNMPQVPLLVELARNVFRRYFIEKFHITSTKQFYTLLKLLPIGLNQKKILSYETKLY